MAHRDKKRALPRIEAEASCPVLRLGGVLLEKPIEESSLMSCQSQVRRIDQSGHRPSP